MRLQLNILAALAAQIREGGFPQARVLSLVETGAHAAAAAEIGPCRRSEKEMTRALLASEKLGANMLLLADRGFYGYGLWSLALSTGASLLWRIKTNLLLPVETRLADGSYLSTVYDSTNRKGCTHFKVRVVEYSLKNRAAESPENQVEVNFYRLLTNIYGHEFAPAAELAGLYHARWEIESLFGEFKKGLSGSSTVIRSRTPLLVEQELWGLIIIHFFIRQIIAESAWRIGDDQDLLSFKKAVHIIRRKLPQTAAFPPSEPDNGE